MPIVLNVITNSKKKTTEISVENYLRAVEVAIVNQESADKKVLDGKYYIKENGKKLQLSDNKDDVITVEYKGQELIADDSSFVIIEKGKIKQIKNIKIGKWYAYIIDGKIKLFNRFPESILVNGSTFNSKIKCLANNVESFGLGIVMKK